jgi:hypothetical protein
MQICKIEMSASGFSVAIPSSRPVLGAGGIAVAVVHQQIRHLRRLLATRFHTAEADISTLPEADIRTLRL